MGTTFFEFLFDEYCTLYILRLKDVGTYVHILRSYLRACIRTIFNFGMFKNSIIVLFLGYLCNFKEARYIRPYYVSHRFR